MASNKELQVAVMGIGWVGGTVARYFQDLGREPLLYDPPKGLGTEADLSRPDVFFICVPTPFDPAKGGFDLSRVEQCVAAIPGEKIVVTKSTILPGSTEYLQARFPQHHLLFNPEFLREKTADADFRRPDRQIMGYTARSRDAAETVLGLLPPAPFTRVLPAAEAELIKYFGNAFLAMKVVFANQIFDLCEGLGLSYEQVSEGAAADPRIGPSHLAVHCDGYRGYGGHCFPKDVRALIQLGDRLGLDLGLLKAVETINNGLTAASGRTAAAGRTAPARTEAPLKHAEPSLSRG